jgi:hydrogenase maturation protease
LVVVIDAIRTGAPPGTMHRLDALDRTLVAPPSASTHGAGVACAVALGRALDRLPERLIVLGIEPAQTDHGDRLSEPIVASFDRLVARAAEEVTSACV